MRHNLQFMAYARWMQGRKANGLRAADEGTEAAAPTLEKLDGALAAAKL